MKILHYIEDFLVYSIRVLPARLVCLFLDPPFYCSVKSICGHLSYHSQNHTGN